MSGTNFKDAGTALEEEVASFLAAALASMDPGGKWLAARHHPITDFAQFRHLEDVRQLIRSDATGTLRDVLGGDYVIKPDVTVRRDGPTPPVLHASIACKWTIRSDRVQNISHEAVILTRHRRGKTPHIAVVTPEPLPSRLASIARGTGEVDKTYHVALPELTAAVDYAGTADQKQILRELITHNRLADVTRLPLDLLA